MRLYACTYMAQKRVDQFVQTATATGYLIAENEMEAESLAMAGCKTHFPDHGKHSVSLCEIGLETPIIHATTKNEYFIFLEMRIEDQQEET